MKVGIKFLFFVSLINVDGREINIFSVLVNKVREIAFVIWKMCFR